MRSLVFRLSALALAAALGACGGGGDPAPVDNGTAFTVGGNAVKGPMDKALVVAYKVNADGTKGDELGRDVSGPDGAYNIVVRDYAGIVLVEVTTTADTTMVDEATGETVTPPLDFSMRASVAAPATTTTQDTKLTLQVNPLTEMAVAKAEKSGGLTTANVEEANAEIRTVYGFSPTDDAPVFTNGVPQNKAAVVFSAISSLAKDGGLACDSASNQADRVKCVVTQLAEKGAQNAEVADALNLQIAVVSQAEGVPETAKPTVNTEIPPVAPEIAALPQVKALMTSLRSNVEALAAPDMSLQTKLQAMQNTVDNSVTPVVDSTFEMLRTMDFGVQLLEDYKAGVVGSTTRANRVTGLPYGAGCTLFTGDKDDAGNYTFRTEATSKDNAEVVGCSSYVSVIRNQQDNVTGTTNTWRWRHGLLIAPKADAAGTYAVKTTARREYGTCSNAAGATSCGTFTQTFAGTADQGKPVVPAGNYTDNSGYSVKRGQEGVADFTRTLTNGNVSGLRLVGSTAPSLAYNALELTPVLDTYGQRHEVDLDVAVTTTGTAETLTLASDAYIKFFSKDTAEGDTVFRSSIGIGKDSYIKAPVAPNAQDGTEAFKLAIGFVSGNSALRGSLEATDAKWDKSKTVYSPTKVTFGGRLETRESATSDWVDFIRGTLTMEATNFADFDASQPTSSANPQIMKATLNAAVTIPNRPVLGVRDMVIVSTDNDPSRYKYVTLAGQYVQGSLVINVNSTATDTTTAVFESASGIKLTYDNTKTVHPLTKSGIKVGEYDSTRKRLTYADDSFEQY